MKLWKGAALAGVARKLYTEAQKPENQRRIRQAVEEVKRRRSGGTSRRRG